MQLFVENIFKYFTEKRDIRDWSVVVCKNGSKLLFFNISGITAWALEARGEEPWLNWRIIDRTVQGQPDQTHRILLLIVHTNIWKSEIAFFSPITRQEHWYQIIVQFWSLLQFPTWLSCSLLHESQTCYPATLHLTAWRTHCFLLWHWMSALDINHNSSELFAGCCF